MNKTNTPFRIVEALILAIVLLSFAVFQGCGDKDDDIPQPANPAHLFEFEVSEPAASSSYQPNDTVWISAGIKSQKAMHDYYIEINDMTAMKRVFLGHGHVHTEGMVHVDTFWVNQVMQPSVMEMVISASDHEGGYHRDTTLFYCHP